jgi:hypothetical protein
VLSQSGDGALGVLGVHAERRLNPTKLERRALGQDRGGRDGPVEMKIYGKSA